MDERSRADGDGDGQPAANEGATQGVSALASGPEPGLEPGGASVTVHWPDGHSSAERIGSDWLAAARSNGLVIPTACLGGSCGACEIEVNGQLVRACISTVPASRRSVLEVELASDPYW